MWMMDIFFIFTLYWTIRNVNDGSFLLYTMLSTWELLLLIFAWLCTLCTLLEDPDISLNLRKYQLLMKDIRLVGIMHALNKRIQSHHLEAHEAESWILFLWRRGRVWNWEGGGSRVSRSSRGAGGVVRRGAGGGGGRPARRESSSE